MELLQTFQDFAAILVSQFWTKATDFEKFVQGGRTIFRQGLQYLIAENTKCRYPLLTCLFQTPLPKSVRVGF